ncbi:MAG: AmmeMemoRadiSam system protein B [Desulfobacteraceae bacterium]|nr:AmmeMemoRadiSam system protein B [Desulfobacteraceae bacterium]
MSDRTPERLRPPAVAGQFYPQDPDELRALVARLTPEPGAGKRLTALAVVSPHAGYVYSGRVAAETFSRVEVPETAVILGPNHHGQGQPAAIMTQGGWRMPGGDIAIDQTLAAAIMRGSTLLRDDPSAHTREHSLEVQVPFLQHHGARKLVPICLSFLNYPQCQELGLALAQAIAASAGPALLVASTDMSHYEPREAATRKDGLALRHLLALDPEGLYQTVLGQRISMCGIIPTTVALLAAIRLGARQAELIRYTDSGETSGDTRQVVGYAGVVIS